MTSLNLFGVPIPPQQPKRRPLAQEAFKPWIPFLKDIIRRNEALLIYLAAGLMVLWAFTLTYLMNRYWAAQECLEALKAPSQGAVIMGICGR